MDQYLESLVKKTNNITEIIDVDTNEAIAEVETADGAIENTVSGAVTAADEVMQEAAETATEDTLDKETQESSNEDIVSTSEKSADNHKENDIINVAGLRVYPTPSINQLARTVAGNVVYLGQIGEFAIIEYMKHGYGVVRGYALTKDLDAFAKR